jgi:hypothetical protein
MFLIDTIHEHVMYLNNSKFFAGLVMIMLNICSKFIAVQFSKSAEEYMKLNITKQVIVFAMAWMGTRDIYTALILTAVFVILSEHLFNEESPYCCVPAHYRVLSKVMDTNGDGTVDKEELDRAIAVLEREKRKQRTLEQRQQFATFSDLWMTTDRATSATQ